MQWHIRPRACTSPSYLRPRNPAIANQQPCALITHGPYQPGPANWQRHSLAYSQLAGPPPRSLVAQPSRRAASSPRGIAASRPPSQPRSLAALWPQHALPPFAPCQCLRTMVRVSATGSYEGSRGGSSAILECPPRHRSIGEAYKQAWRVSGQAAMSGDGAWGVPGR